jgi:heme/copper-type cytochrome/quinol oxidase subunit 1
MQRRIAIYPSNQGWNFLNLLSSIGAYILGLGVVPMLWNVFRSLRKGERVGDNPWDGMTLEWACSSPPPHHNFESLPPIRSERPLWDAVHPEERTLPHGRHAHEPLVPVGVAAGPGEAGGDGGPHDGDGGDGAAGNGGSPNGGPGP